MIRTKNFFPSNDHKKHSSIETRNHDAKVKRSVFEL